MIIHKRNAKGKILCGRETKKVGNAYFWEMITCQKCLAWRPGSRPARLRLRFLAHLKRDRP